MADNKETPVDDKQEEVIDEGLMDDLAGEMEEKLNLTAGERTNEDDLDPEMDQHFEDFIKKMQQDPSGGAAMGDMMKMMQQMLGGMGGPEGMGGMGGAGAFPTPGDEMSDDKLDSMTDTLLEQFMDKEVLYEPLQSAKEELTANLSKDTVTDEDKNIIKKQLVIIDELIETFEKDPTNKKKLISLFEEMNKIGSFFDLISKYSPEHADKKEGFEQLNNLMGGGFDPFKKGGAGGAGGAPNPEDCRLI